MKLGFVILAYGKPDMVVECVRYIENLNLSENAHIVVVDNNSPNKAGEIIRDRLKEFNNVFVFLNTKNSGFAKGNNIGYKLCAEKYGCDTIIVMNSDAFIDDENFIDKLDKIVSDNPDISIIAPDIVEDSFKHKNPLSINKNDMNNVSIYLRTILLDAISNILLYLHIDYFKYKKRNEKANYNTQKIQKDQYDIVPHGACIIFCKKWVSKESNAFYNGTFLFCEEHFLYAYAKEKNHSIVYKPTLVIRHLGDGSINHSVQDERNKRIFVNKHQMRSFSLFIRKRKKIVRAWNED